LFRLKDAKLLAFSYWLLARNDEGILWLMANC